MMIYRVIVTDQAQSDLENIFEYIAIKLHSPYSASKLIKKLTAAMHNIELFPEGNRRYWEEPWYSRNLRIMSVDKYCVLYYPDSENLMVRIYRVVNSRLLKESSEIEN